MSAQIISFSAARSNRQRGQRGPLDHPLLFANINIPNRARAARIIASGWSTGATIDAMTRELAALGLDRRAAEGIARTGIAVVSADARAANLWSLPCG